MYFFESRFAAGRLLADEIEKRYAGQPCAVVALSDGGVMVGAQIAMRLHAVLTLLLSEEIILPQEIISIGGITQDGSFSYNSAFSPGEIDELAMEYHGVIEQEKLQKLHRMNEELIRGDGLLPRELIEHRNIILVSDGLPSGFALDLALVFLKPFTYRKLIVATPFASVPAVDRMHVLADEIFCLNVLQDYISTDHYYDTQDVPSHDMAVRAVQEIISHWKHHKGSSKTRD